MTAIALRNLFERKLRAVLTALAVVLGVMMVAGTYVLTDTIQASFDEIFTESNVGIDAVVSSAPAIDSEDGSEPPIDESVLPLVKKVDGVRLAGGAIFDPQVAIIGTDGERIGGGGAPTFGAAVPEVEELDTFTYEGETPQDAGQVVIDKHTADSEGFEIGDQVTVAGKESAKAYELVGLASLGEVDSFGGASIALFTLPEAQRITGKAGELDQVGVVADDGVDPKQVVAAIEKVLPKGVEVETGEQNTQSQKDDVGEFIGFLKTALLVFSGVALFVASFLIFNTFSITVAQRVREFAMLRTLGANRRQILAAVAGEALIIGVVASVIGLAAGIGFAPVINSLFEQTGIDLPNTGTVIATRTVIVALLLGTLLTLAAALIPALRATRVPPVAGLREGVMLSAPPGQHRRRDVIATLLTIAGVAALTLGTFGLISPGEVWVGVGAFLVFIGVAMLSHRLVKPLASVVGIPMEKLRGVSGRLARENTIRNPGRTAATAAALMIGLALVTFVSVFAAGIKGSIDNAIDKTLSADLLISNSDGFSDIPLGTAAVARSVEGVQAVSPYSYTEYSLDGKSNFISLVEPETAAEVLKLDWREGGTDQLLTDLGATDAVLDEGFADEKGFEIGDSFDALTASGKTITYTVTGTFKDNTDFIGDFAASDVNADAYGEGASTTNVFITLADDADPDAVQDELAARLDKDFPTSETQNQQELKDSIGEQLNTLVGAVYALLALAVIVSLFGIVNTLALSIYERTRELGLLRAVGMSRRQVRRVVRYESVITALIGATLGVILGTIFSVLISRPLADEGFILTIPIVTLLLFMALAVVAGVIAAILPARRASRLDVLESLAYE